MEMTISSVVTAIPKGCRGPRVLLIEPNKRILELHAYVLSQNSYQVTSVLDTASGLSMIMNGHIFECVLVDADREMDIVKFLNQILEHPSQPSVIMMASVDIRLRIATEAQGNMAVSWIQKPCASRDISDYLQHICRKRIAIQEDHSNEQLPEENQALNINDRVDPMCNPSEIQDSTMAYSNISSSHSTQQGQHLMAGGMVQAVTNGDGDQEDIDGITVQETTGDATLQNVDKGKKKLELQNGNDRPEEKDNPRKKRKAHQKRIIWTPELHNKFVEVVKALGKQKAIPSAIHKRMNVPGLTRYHVMSHLQNYRERENVIKDIVSPVQRGNNWHVENLTLNRSWQSASSDDPSITHSRPLKLNCIGTSFMTLENIKAKLQGAPSLPVPLVTTTMDNFGAVQGTDNNFSDPFQPLMSATSMSTTFGLVDNFSSNGQHNEVQMASYPYENVVDQLLTCENSSNHAFGGSIESSGVSATVASDNNLAVYANTFSNGFDYGNFEVAADGGVSEAPTPIECVGFATEPWVAGSGGTASSFNHGYGNAMEPPVTGENSSNHTFGEAMTLSSASATVQSDYNLGIYANNFWNGFENGNFECTGSGGGFGEAMAPLDSFGITTEPWVVSGGGTQASSGLGLEDLTFPEFLPGDLGSICQSPDFHGNRQDLFPDFSPSTILSDYVPREGIGSSTNSNLDYVPSEGNNSQSQIQTPVNCIFGFDGSDGRGDDVDPFFINLSPSDLETALEILNEVDAGLINGPW